MNMYSEHQVRLCCLAFFGCEKCHNSSSGGASNQGENAAQRKHADRLPALEDAGFCELLPNRLGESTHH